MRIPAVASSVSDFFRYSRPNAGARAVFRVCMGTPEGRSRSFSTRSTAAAALGRRAPDDGNEGWQRQPPSVWRVTPSDTAPTPVLNLRAPWLILLGHARVFPFVARRTVCVENVPLVAEGVAERKKQARNRKPTALVELVGEGRAVPAPATGQSAAARPTSYDRLTALPAAPGARRTYCSGGPALAQQTLETLEKTPPSWMVTPAFVPDNVRDMMAAQLKKSITKVNTERMRLKECLAMKDTPEMRQRIRETLHQALTQFGPIKAISVFETHKRTSLPTRLAHLQNAALGLGFIEFTQSASLDGVLSPECQLFGIAWPSHPKPTGHVVYPFPLQACRALLIKWGTPSAEDKAQNEHLESTQSKSKMGNRVKRATPILSANTHPKEALVAILKTLYQVASRFSRTRLKTTYLARRIGVKIRHCAASDRGHSVVAHSLSIRKVKLRVPCQLNGETVMHGSRRALPLAEKNSRRASFGDTSRVALHNGAPARVGSSFGSAHSEGFSHGHAGVLSSLSAAAVRGGGLQGRLTPSLSMATMAESLLKSHNMKKKSGASESHSHQLVLTFASFRITYAAFVILSQSPALKGLEATFFSQMPAS